MNLKTVRFDDQNQNQNKNQAATFHCLKNYDLEIF